MNSVIQVKDRFAVGENQPLLLIAGPCQIESRDHALKMAEKLKKITDNFPLNFVYKSSFDKANRTSLNSARGVGFEQGLEILKEVSETFDVPTLTDIHTAEQAQPTSEYVDIIQIPAFLCRQTDLLVAAGKTDAVINIKKGQFLHPSDLLYSAEKAMSSGNKNILLCERGTCFGYRDLVVDFRNFKIMSELGFPVVFDATHSVQNMGGAGGKSAGNREFIESLTLAACATNISALFLEVHEDPDNAPSDGPNMLQTETLRPLLEKICSIRAALS